MQKTVDAYFLDMNEGDFFKNILKLLNPHITHKNERRVMQEQTEPSM